MWGVTIATSGTTTASVFVPSASKNYTWQELRIAWGTWDNLVVEEVKWSNADKLIFSASVLASAGTYARKYLKLPKKLRFRQAYFTVSTEVKTNSVGDAAVRIYDITAFIDKKEGVVAQTT